MEVKIYEPVRVYEKVLAADIPRNLFRVLFKIRKKEVVLVTLHTFCQNGVEADVKVVLHLRDEGISEKDVPFLLKEIHRRWKRVYIKNVGLSIIPVP